MSGIYLTFLFLCALFGVVRQSLAAVGILEERSVDHGDVMFFYVVGGASVAYPVASGSSICSGLAGLAA